MSVRWTTTLTVFCDHPDHLKITYGVNRGENFFGQTLRECANKSKKAGWRIEHDEVNEKYYAFCPICDRHEEYF